MPLMITCIFCAERLKNGQKNHMLHTHKLKEKEYELLYTNLDVLAIRKKPFGLTNPVLNDDDPEFREFYKKYIDAANFLFDDYQKVRSERKYKLAEKQIRQNIQTILTRKYEHLNLHIDKLGGAEYIYRKHELIALEKLLNAYINKTRPSITQTFWKNMEFLDGFIYINYEENRKFKLLVPSSTVLLNYLKDTYFSVKYPEYDVQVNTKLGKVKIEYINGDPIEEILSLNKSEIQIEIFKNTNAISASSNLNGGQKSDILDKLKKNQFIQHLISLLNKNDEVYPLEELNNGKIEYSLIFVFHRSNNSVIILENENPNRSAHILISPIYSKEILEKINYFFSSSIPNKRRYLMLNYQKFISELDDTMEFKRIKHVTLKEYQTLIFNLL
jgi:hypothetical protein